MDPFATLGLPQRYALDLAVAEKAHRELSRALHPDRYAQAGASERRDALSRAVEVNEAFRTVRDPISRAEALMTLLGIAVGDGHEPKADPTFLMDMLEQREALAEARASRNAVAIADLRDAVRATERDAQAELAAGFDSGRAGELVGKLGELRFYRRFIDEAQAILDDLSDRASTA
jgi:molecular chaperone HscB